MNPIKLIRKLGKVLRGGATFRDMFLGVFLGFAIGMIPGVNLTLIVLIVLLLFLNANGALAMVSILLGKVLCLALAQLTFQLGYWMIHDLGLAGLVRAAAETPVAALLDLHVYSLMGALPLIVIIGGALAWFVARSVLKMRAGLAAATAGSGALRKAAENKFARFVTRILFGKQKETFARMAEKNSPLIRKGRVIAAVIVVALLAAGQFVFLDTFVKAGLERSIAAVNGAEVDIKSAELSLGSGRLVINGLQVTDAAHPSRNKVQAERIIAQISVRDLLARRFVVDLIECRALRTDAERKSPGEVFRQPEKAKADLADSLLVKLGGKSAEYYAEVKKFNKRLQELRKYLESDDSKASRAGGPDKDTLARKAKAMGYLRLSAKDYLTRHPTWVIRRIKVSRIEVRPDLPTFTVEGKNLSSHPSLYQEKMELRATPDKDALKAFLAKGIAADMKTGDRKNRKKGKVNLLDRLLKKK